MCSAISTALIVTVFAGEIVIGGRNSIGMRAATTGVA